jgi:uncharacterized protein with PIN domain
MIKAKNFLFCPSGSMAPGQNRICFATDRTLGKLVKWLRLLGFDAVYAPTENRADLFFKMQEPARTLLTRIHAIFHGMQEREIFLIHANSPFEQLKEIIRVKHLKRTALRPFTRCIACNLLLESIEKTALAGQVPDYIWHCQETFCKCRGCGRIFWPGSHKQHGLDRILALFAEE